MVATVERSPELEKRLRAVISFLQATPESGAWDSAATAQMVEHVVLCRAQLVKDIALKDKHGALKKA